MPRQNAIKLILTPVMSTLYRLGELYKSLPMNKYTKPMYPSGCSLVGSIWDVTLRSQVRVQKSFFWITRYTVLVDGVVYIYVKLYIYTHTHEANVVINEFCLCLKEVVMYFSLCCYNMSAFSCMLIQQKISYKLCHEVHVLICFSVVHAVNKQLNDKERVAAALENPNLVDMVDECLGPSYG